MFVKFRDQVSYLIRYCPLLQAFYGECLLLRDFKQKFNQQEYEECYLGRLTRIIPEISAEEMAVNYHLPRPQQK